MLGLSDQADESRIHMMVRRGKKIKTGKSGGDQFQEKERNRESQREITHMYLDYLPNAQLSHPERGRELSGE